MLQRALAATLGVLGLVVLGLAIASATVWRSSDTLVASATAAEGYPLVVTEAGVLDMVADEVTVVVSAPAGTELVAAVGRTDDVVAWVESDPSTHVVGLEDPATLATATAEPTTPSDAPAEGETAPEEAAPEEGAPEEAAPEEGAPEEAAPEEAPVAEDDAEVLAPDPRGSDLWVEEVRGTGSVTLEWPHRQGRWSMIAAAPGTGVTPTITMTWPQEVSTPFLVPGIAVGSVLLLAGGTWLALLVLTGRAARRRPAPEAVAPVPVATTDEARPLTRRELRLREQGAGGRRRPAADTSRVLPGPWPVASAPAPQAAATQDAPPDRSVADRSPVGRTVPDHQVGHGHRAEQPAGDRPERAHPAGDRPERAHPAGGQPAPRASDVSGRAWREMWGLGPSASVDGRQGPAEDPAAGTNEEEGR